MLCWSLLVAAAYFGAGRLGLLAATRSGVIVVWPAAGVAVAAVLLGGRRMLAAVAIGSLATSLSTGESLAVAVIAVAAATLEPLVAATLLKRSSFRAGLGRTEDVVAFVAFAGVIGPALAAVPGILSLLVAGTVSSAHLLPAWRDLTFGDLSGVLLLGSAILVSATSGLPDRVPIRTRLISAGETAAVLALLTLAGYLVLRDGTLPYLALPLLFALAFVYGRRGATHGALVLSTVAVILTVRGHGPFHTGRLDTDLIRALIFLCVGAVTAQLVAAARNERRLAEEAVVRLAASETALAEAQRLAHLGSFDSDLRTGRHTWSRELYRILGRDPRSLPAGWRAWRDCVHPDDLRRLEEATRLACSGRGPSTVLHRILRPDGQVRTVEAHLHFECDDDGRPARVFGTCQDVTARKLAEERFRALFEDAPYPILVLDGAGQIVLSNLRAQTMFGLPTTELVGRQVEELVLRTAGAERPWYRSEADGSPSATREIELVARRADGEELSVEVSLTPLVAEEGELVSATIRDITEIRAAAETLSYQARHDSLTGLPNRVLFLERLEMGLLRARHTGRPLAVVFLDLDDFKAVNDTCGHDVGDALLAALTPRLNAAVRHGDTIARLGGDEFVVLCEDLPDEAQAMYIAERITDVSHNPIHVAGRKHAISISAGVVLVLAPEEVTAHSVLRDADAAMYAAKAGGKGRVAVFDESMRERLMERVAVEASLRGARSRGELELHYQPVVALQDNRVVAVEALLRWQHPIRGLLAPSEFMQVAEATGLIADMGEWVLEEACRQATLWREIARPGRAVPVSVNISAHQLIRADLAGAVQRILRRTGLEPHLLILEVTEGTLLEDMNAARRELARLKELGVRLVVDDFGTGYSSLSALRDLMIDGLKLDRSFVEALAGAEDGSGAIGSQDDDSGVLVGAVLSLATALDAEVTAEGVETWSQVTSLRRHGCDYAQGYLFARPGPASELTALLAAGSAGSGGASLVAPLVR